jgi:hypothetical protein
MKINCISCQIAFEGDDGDSYCRDCWAKLKDCYCQFCDKLVCPECNDCQNQNCLGSYRCRCDWEDDD